MSGLREAVLGMTEAVEAESRAMREGSNIAAPRAMKGARAEALLALAGGSAADVPNGNAPSREELSTLAAALRRNKAMLEAERDAARELARDLSRRLAAIDADGTYTRGELMGDLRAMPALPAPAAT